MKCLSRSTRMVEKLVRAKALARPRWWALKQQVDAASPPPGRRNGARAPSHACDSATPTTAASRTGSKVDWASELRTRDRLRQAVLRQHPELSVRCPVDLFAAKRDARDPLERLVSLLYRLVHEQHLSEEEALRQSESLLSELLGRGDTAADAVGPASPTAAPAPLRTPLSDPITPVQVFQASVEDAERDRTFFSLLRRARTSARVTEGAGNESVKR
ncbi:hypothetical protein CDCA_CDCA15G4020 [Cyanidium caldarium]|uniref:Uncharacterized protein n=1 Tax=Cyanidium caldarium TaxID=2771 RepID=A0AAV9J084_CYACA|nr:hypothetical protein CDCA_CDCA15G4020 [Cyanidium caldarium]